MTTPSKGRLERERQKLRKQLADLRRRVAEAESTVEAIRAGEVDAVVVTSEREAVFTLETADRPYRLLVDHERDPAAAVSCDGTILACNGHFAHLLEQPPESLVNQPLEAHVPPERRADVEALLRSAQQQVAEGAEGPVELVRADGQAVPVYWSVTLIREGAAGECLLVIDVTERKLYEERRHRAEQFESLVNDAPIGIFLVNSDFRIVQVNPIARPLFGDLADNVVGRDFEQVIHHLALKPRADEVVDIFRRTLATGESYSTPEPVRSVRSGVAVGYLEWRVIRITLPDGRFGLVCYVSDVTAHVAARDTLRDADRRKDEFLAMLAHELRNPLAPIRNALSTLQAAGSHSEVGVRARKVLGRQVEQMTRLIDDLVDVNRISRGSLELRKTPLELGSIVQHAVAMCRPMAEGSRQQIVVTLPTETVYVNADSVRLSQILYNVLHNACKYTQPGGRIVVTAERSAGDVVFSIKDNGIGIAPEKLESVFEMFSQVQTSLEESRGGLGIGLTLVKRLVELHGGTVVVRSDGLGKGSEFVIRLPIVTDQAPAPDQPRATPVRAETKRRILVVDDNRDTADSLAALLQLSGHDARVALDGEAAIGAAEQYEPDVILLDIGLPKVNGYDACRRMREHPWGKRATIFALTGWGQEEDRRKSREAGFDGHFVKPVDHRELMEALAYSRASLT